MEFDVIAADSGSGGVVAAAAGAGNAAAHTVFAPHDATTGSHPFNNAGGGLDAAATGPAAAATLLVDAGVSIGAANASSVVARWYRRNEFELWSLAYLFGIAVSLALIVSVLVKLLCFTRRDPRLKQRKRE